MTKDDFFPFQVVVRVSTDSRCKIQKKLTKYKINGSTFDEKIQELSIQIAELLKLNSKRSSIKATQLQRLRGFLEKIEPYFKERYREYFGGKELSFLKHKNQNIFYYSHDVGALKKLKGVRTTADIWFHPNTIAADKTEKLNATSGQPYITFDKKKTTTGKLIVSKLNFFFLDLDGVKGGYDEIKKQIEVFNFQPDVAIQSSKGSYHLYWSIQPIELNESVEGNDGSQLDQHLLLYLHTLSALITLFGGDPHRSNATSLLRVPDTLNYKPDKGRRPHKCQYLPGSRTLIDTMSSPKFTFESIVDRLTVVTSTDLQEQARADFQRLSSEIPIIFDEPDHVDVLSKTKSQQKVEEIESKIEIDFSRRWENALKTFCTSYGVSDSFFTSNDRLIFKHLWTNRLREVVHFPPVIRESLKGAGLKYSELNQSINKIATLPRRKSKKRSFLIVKTHPHQKPSQDRPGRLTGYTLSQEFSLACGINRQRSRADWIEKLTNELYTKGHRNDSIPYDCFILQSILGYEYEQAREFLNDKIRRSANQPQKELRCSADTSNVEAWLNYYYK